MPRAWALLGLGFLLGRVDLLGLIWPFGPAFCAAAGEFYPRLAGPLGAAASLGALSRGEVGVALAQAACCGLSALATWRWPGRGPRRTLLLLAAAGALPYGTLILWQHPNPYGALLLTFQLIISVLLAAAFRQGIQPAGLPVGGLLGAGERLIPLSLLAAGAVAGFKGLTLGPLELSATAAALIVGAAGWAGGPGIGAAAGIVIGAVESLAQAGGMPAMGVHGLAGLMAGLSREWGRPGSALGCALGLVAGWLAAGADHSVLLGGLLGAALLLVLPALPAVPARVAPPAPGPSPRGPGSRSAAPVEANARWAEMARLLREVSRSCREVATAAEQAIAPEKEPAALVSRLMNEVCTGCNGYRRCWQDAFPAHYGLAVDLLNRAEEAAVEADRVDGLWGWRCVRPREVALFVNQVSALRQAERRWMRRLGESRELMAGHFQGLAGIIEDLSRGEEGEHGEDRPGRNQRSGRLTYVTEVAKLARPGWMISGDSHLVRELPGMQLLLALSDGMGCGFPAASESRAAIDLVEKLLRAGFDRKTVVRMANSLMGLRSPGETFATLDLALVDLGEGKAEFIKVGAAPTFLVTGGRVTVIKSRSLPLGILDAADMESSRVTLKPGETVVMVTDGVLEGSGDLSDREAWVKEIILSRATSKGATGLARALLEEVSLNLSRDRADDITVLAVHFLQGAEG